MPGQQLKSTWVGNRAELLSIYALSSIAAVTHVRREEDFGFDLLCTLLTQHKNVLRAGRSFGIQVKSSGYTEIRYGGLNKNGNWKSYEIEWLFNQDQPILIAVADVKNWTIRLYNTSRIWYLYYQVGPGPGEIVLLPDEELVSGELNTQSNQWRYEENELALCDDGKLAGNGYSYQIPLGKPIAELSLDNNDDDFLSEVQSTLEKWLELEYKNIVQRNLGIPYYFEWSSWLPNQIPGPESIVFAFWNTGPGANIPRLLRAISPSVESLLLHLRHQNDFKRAEAIIPFARWLKDDGLLGKIGLDALNDIENQ